jgi:hypothetical protein
MDGIIDLESNYGKDMSSLIRELSAVAQDGCMDNKEALIHIFKSLSEPDQRKVIGFCLLINR